MTKTWNYLNEDFHKSPQNTKHPHCQKKRVREMAVLALTVGVIFETSFNCMHENIINFHSSVTTYGIIERG